MITTILLYLAAILFLAVIVLAARLCVWAARQHEAVAGALTLVLIAAFTAAWMWAAQ